MNAAVKKAIDTRIKEIKQDSRYKDKPAQVQINAPLALIQVSMKSEIRALEWVLARMKETT